MHVQTCAATAAEMLKSLASRDEHDERTDGPGWLGGSKDRRMDGWMDGYIFGWLVECLPALLAR